MNHVQVTVIVPWPHNRIIPGALTFTLSDKVGEFLNIEDVHLVLRNAFRVEWANIEPELDGISFESNICVHEYEGTVLRQIDDCVICHISVHQSYRQAYRTVDMEQLCQLRITPMSLCHNFLLKFTLSRYPLTHFDSLGYKACIFERHVILASFQLKDESCWPGTP